MKSDLFKKLKKEAIAYASRFHLSFYEHFASELSYAKEIFFSHPLVLRCSEDVLPFLHDDFGHGIEHSKKVAIEAAALVMIEFFHSDSHFTRHLMILAEICGLMHDICRLEPEHAQEGAYLAKKILKDYPLSDEDKNMIFFAIKNHEAFKKNENAPNYMYSLLSGALYDADKFRWGPDNFTTTLWEMCDYQEWSLDRIVKNFPKGMEVIKSISNTFRTPTGQIYGPEFIDAGLKIGNYIYNKLVASWEK